MQFSIILVLALFQSINPTVAQGGDLLGDTFGTIRNAVCNLGASNSSGFSMEGLFNQDFLSGIDGKSMVSQFLNSKSMSRISSDCLSHVLVFIQALTRREEWAIRMVDAIGKPPSGLLNFKLLWPGDWDECVQINAVVYEDPVNKTKPSNPFTGKYCSVTYSLKQLVGQEAPLTTGFCFPSTCSSSDVKELLILLGKYLPLNTTKRPEPAKVSCRETSYKLDGTAIAVLAVCAIFVTVMVLATLYDVLYVNWIAMKQSPTSEGKYKQNGIAVQNGTSHPDKSSPEIVQASVDVVTDTRKDTEADQGEYKPDVLGKLLLSFSVFTNGTKLLNTSQPKGSLTAVHGIRFLSMSWVIVGHSFGWFGVIPGVAENYLQYAGDMTKKFEFEPILNGTFSVDTFFVLSGLLVAYLSLKEMKKRSGPRKFHWGMFYFHRFWRLTPAYMLILMLYVALTKYLSTGPFWSFDDFQLEDCKKGWWRNLLYVNNLVEPENTCMGWTWYLANDMQFYVISPIMLVPLYYSSVLGGLSCLAVLSVSLISSGLIARHYDLPMSLLDDQSKTADYMSEYYFKPWCRVGPYAVGFFTGYLLYRSELKMRIPKIVNAVCWLLATVLGCLIVYGTWVSDPPIMGVVTRDVSPSVTYLYTATARSVWAACVSWLIFACANGYGGPVNHILSWPGFVPLGRLTYCAYLVHLILMSAYLASRFTTMHLYDYGAVYDTLGHFVMSYAAAFVLSLAFEAPMMGLEKVLLKK